MRRCARLGLLAVGACLGLAATIVLLSTLAVGATDGSVGLILRGTVRSQKVEAAVLPDLVVRAMAPAQVNAGETYVANVSAANKGHLSAPDNWVRVTLPEGTHFVEATYVGGAPRPPDEVDGRVLTWHLSPMPADSTWAHILVVVRADAGLAVGTVLDVVAEVGGSAPESDLENNTATATSVVKDAGGDPPYRCYLPLVSVQ